MGIGAVQIHGQHLNAAREHFVHDLEGAERILLLLAGLLAFHLDFAHAPAHRLAAQRHHHAVEILAAHGEIGGVIFHRAVHLVPAEAERRDHVGGGMRLGEHVFDLEAGIDVPLRHAVLAHGLLVLVRELGGRLALSGDLHDLERHLWLEALLQ